MTKPLGVQLYTFRDPARFGGPGFGLDRPTLEAIAAMGYSGVETVDVPGGDAREARTVLADLGLAVTSSHTWAGIDDLEAFERAAAAIADLASPRIVVSGSGLEAPGAVTAFADRLGAASEAAGRHGLGLAYHNHSAELATVDGTTILDRLADLTDPAIAFQVDIFWVVVGGADPAEVITRLGDRVVSLHLKDGVTLPASADGGLPFVNVPVGSGVVDPAPAIAAAEALPGVEWLIVEFDHVDGPPLDGVRGSIDNLLAAGLGRGRSA